jgi:hypothetical protein
LRRSSARKRRAELAPDSGLVEPYTSLYQCRYYSPCVIFSFCSRRDLFIFYFCTFSCLIHPRRVLECAPLICVRPPSGHVCSCACVVVLFSRVCSCVSSSPAPSSFHSASIFSFCVRPDEMYRREIEHDENVQSFCFCQLLSWLYRGSEMPAVGVRNRTGEKGGERVFRSSKLSRTLFLLSLLHGRIPNVAL